MQYDRLHFKIASETEEFEQIHRLNYRTFVEEIPQHPTNNEKMLVDRFHDENTYLVCLDGSEVAGMIAMRSGRPFSLDDKVPGLDSYLPSGASVCEFRLLAVEPSYRKPGVFLNLLKFAVSEGIKMGYNLAIASGTLRQTRLYSRIGFVPFSSPVGTVEASYQPMYLTLSAALELFDRLGEPCFEALKAVSFMPGPVETSAAVQRAVALPPVSHRSVPFLDMMADLKSRLTHLTGAENVELLLGSGTLGNDVVAAQLKLLKGRGVVLTNGEFGDRLIDHARRMGLDFELLSFGWGESYNLQRVEELLDSKQDLVWLWSVHCETSTGILNDLSGLEKLCSNRGINLCLDCTSSLGTVEVDLRGAYLACSVSGKGLAALPGVSLVFSNHPVSADCRIPRYLDLGYYREKGGTPFTHSSNLLAALRQALMDLKPCERFESLRQVSAGLRERLLDAGFELLGSGSNSSPAVISILLPKHLSSLDIGEAMESHGWLLSYRSGYLLERNIIQICLMGNVTREQCQGMVEAFVNLARIVGH